MAESFVRTATIRSSHSPGIAEHPAWIIREVERVKAPNVFEKRYHTTFSTNKGLRYYNAECC